MGVGIGFRYGGRSQVSGYGLGGLVSRLGLGFKTGVRASGLGSRSGS